MVRESLRILISSHMREMWDWPCLNKVMVALTLRAQVACIQARGKGKEYIVRKYLDGCVKSSNYCNLFFLFIFFSYIILNFVRQAKKLTRYKRPVHPAVWSQTTSSNSPSRLPPAESPLTLPDTFGTNELSGAMGRKLQAKEQAWIQRTKNPPQTCSP